MTYLTPDKAWKIMDWLRKDPDIAKLTCPFGHSAFDMPAWKHITCEEMFDYIHRFRCPCNIHSYPIVREVALRTLKNNGYPFYKGGKT